MKPACVEMRPKLDESIALFASSQLPNFAVFVRLRISNRISPDWLPAEPRRPWRARDRCSCGTDYRASPIVRGALPYWPAPGFANAAALNQRASGWSSDADSVLVAARRVRIAGQIRPLPAAEEPEVRVRHAAADHRVQRRRRSPARRPPRAFQPPSSAYAGRCCSPASAIRTIGARMIRCGESKLLVPYSASRS